MVGNQIVNHSFHIKRHKFHNNKIELLESAAHSYATYLVNLLLWSKPIWYCTYRLCFPQAFLIGQAILA